MAKSSKAKVKRLKAGYILVLPEDAARFYEQNTFFKRFKDAINEALLINEGTGSRESQVRMLRKSGYKIIKVRLAQVKNGKE